MTGLLVLIAVYGLALVGTVLRQFPTISSSRFLRWDTLGVLPGFSFFAPQPGSNDYALVYRTAHGGVVGGWRDPFRLTRRSAWAGLWNPSKRLRKAITDASGALAHEMMASRRGDPRILLSIPYLLLLNFASSLAVDDATHVQFAVLASSWEAGSRHVELLVLSEMHELQR